MNITGQEKAKVLLKILGPEVTSLVLEYLPEDLAKSLSVSLSQMPPPGPDIVKFVLREMQVIFLEGASPERKAIESKDFETEKKAPPQPKEEMRARDMSKAERIIQAIRGESDQTIAFILSNLNKELRDDVYFNLPADVVERVNKLEVMKVPVSDKVYKSIEKIILK